MNIEKDKENALKFKKVLKRDALVLLAIAVVTSLILFFGPLIAIKSWIE